MRPQGESCRFLSAPLLLATVLLFVPHVGEAAPQIFREGLDLSPASIVQTFGNMFRLPTVLGGRPNADSDVRFGIAPASIDPLGDLAEQFESSPSRDELFYDEDDDSGGEYAGFVGPSSAAGFNDDADDIFGRSAPVSPERRPHERSNARPGSLGLLDRQGRSDEERQPARPLKSADDGPDDKADFVGLTMHTFNPGRN